MYNCIVRCNWYDLKIGVCLWIKIFEKVKFNKKKVYVSNRISDILNVMKVV